MTPEDKHPDVVPYAQYDPLTPEQRAGIEQHLVSCEECRDLVLFIRKTNATLQYEGKISRVAKALEMGVEQLEHEIRLGTSVGALIDRPPEWPVRSPVRPIQPLFPGKKVNGSP